MTLLLVGAAFLAGVDLFIVNVAFDDIRQDFSTTANPPSLSDLSWILNAYAVIYAALLIPFGRLTDKYGRKHGFTAGLLLFTAASAACALSDNVWQLVTFRALQAVGAAAMTPASLGLLLASLPVERRAAAARLWATTGALAAAFGPAFGGLLVQASWHWAFWINVPLGIAIVAATWIWVPDVRHNDQAPRPDLLGAATLTVAVGALVLALVQGPVGRRRPSRLREPATPSALAPSLTEIFSSDSRHRQPCFLHGYATSIASRLAAQASSRSR